MAPLQAQRVPAAFGGWNTESAPDAIPDTQAPLVENLLCRPGRLAMRGPIHHGSGSLGFAPGSRPAAFMLKDASGLATTVDPTSAVDNANLQLLATGVSASGTFAPTVDNTPTGRSVEVGSYVWGKAVSGRFIRWDGSAAAPTSYTEPNAPFGFADIEVFAERIFVAGGTVNGTGAANRLLFSDPGGPTAGTVADWTDNVSGLVNQIVVGDAQPIIAIRAVERMLVIFKKGSIWALAGSGSSSFAVRRLTDYGCVHQGTITVLGDAVYFLGDSGYMRFDGAVARPVSGAINGEVIQAAADLLTPPASTTMIATAARLRSDCLLLAISSQNTSTLAITPRFQALYDTQRGVWTKFSSAVLANGAILLAQYVPRWGHTVASDGQSVFYISDIATPSPISYLDSPLTLRDTVSGTTAAIAAEWHSRLIRLASPLNASQLQRLLFDYRMDIGADTPSWYVSLIRGDGTAAVDEYQVPGEAAGAPTYVSRRRATKEAFGEAVDVQLRVEWRGSTDAFTIAEVYDATIVYQATHQRSAA